MRNSLPKASALALLLSAGAPVLAQSTHMMMPEGSYDLDVGLAAFDTNSNEGGVGRRAAVLPFANVQWSNGVFLALGEIGVSLPAPANMSYGPVFFYGVKPERADSVDTGTRIGGELGGFVRYDVLHNAGISARMGYGGGDQHRGTRLDLEGWVSTPLTTHQSLALSLGVSMADHTYMQSYFGITPAQGARGHHDAYRADAGVKNTYASLGWSAELSTKYDVAAGLGLNRLGTSAAASPLTINRTRSTFFSSLTYHY